MFLEKEKVKTNELFDRFEKDRRSLYFFYVVNETLISFFLKNKNIPSPVRDIVKYSGRRLYLYNEDDFRLKFCFISIF